MLKKYDIMMLKKSLLKDDCKIGPARDEHNLIDSLKALQAGWKAKSPEKSWDISMEISAKQDNVYMGTKIKCGFACHFVIKPKF